MRLVIDTNVVVAALRSQRGASAELLRRAIGGRIALIGTLSLALEYLDVCTRAQTRAGTTVSEGEAQKFVEEVVALLQPVERHYRWRPVGPDASDDHVIEAALNGGAEALVTFNAKDFAEASRRFSLPVVTPADILHTLETSHG